eukprot:scaffold64420_cov37-Tisochrysis_lutea.AAC.3
MVHPYCRHHQQTGLKKTKPDKHEKTPRKGKDNRRKLSTKTTRPLSGTGGGGRWGSHRKGPGQPAISNHPARPGPLSSARAEASRENKSACTLYLEQILSQKSSFARRLLARSR